MDNDRQPSRSLIGLPGAIIIAAAILALAFIWIHKPTASSNTNNQQAATPSIDDQASGMAAVTNSDHILGNPQAPIKLVEYSDPSCPYCQMFNPTMEAIMNAYGPGGQVAWVYRQFPLDKPVTKGGPLFHPNSGREAAAFECAGSIGGNSSFFAYMKHWFEIFPQNGADRTETVDDAQIYQAAKDIGLDMTAFNACESTGEFKDKLDQSYADGINAGVTGTPYTILITPSGTRIPLEGAVAYSTLKSAIDTLITNMPAEIRTATSTVQFGQ